MTAFIELIPSKSTLKIPSLKNFGYLSILNMRALAIIAPLPVISGPVTVRKHYCFAKMKSTISWTSKLRSNNQ